MKVSAYIKTDGACDLYRAVQPITMLGQYTDCQAALINLWDNEDTKATKLDADVLIFPRIVDEGMIVTIKAFQSMGKKIVVEYDDDLFNVSPFSPHYRDHGTKEYHIKLPNGELYPMWEEGKNLDIKTNIKRSASFKKILAIADMVTVTTPHLAKVYEPYNRNVVALPNCVDMDIWQSLPLKEVDEIRLFWAGGSSHYEDWFLLRDVIPIVMKKYPKIKLVLLGMKWEATLEGISEDRIEYHPWIPTPAYPYKTAILNPTIGLIPLVDNEFNRCKSSIKWLEWGALGIPCITSNVSPYKEIATEDNGIYIENNSPSSWIEGISLLVEDSILRAKIGGIAKRYVEDNFDARKNVHLWKDAYESLLEEERVAS